MSKVIMVTGGSRSGKSVIAEQKAKEYGKRSVLYLATAIPVDDDMKERIRIHQERRDSEWGTYEGYRDLGEVVKSTEKNTILLDCVTVMITNILCEDEERDFDKISASEVEKLENEVIKELSNLVKAIRDEDKTLIIVSNEVGMSVVPSYRLGRIFSDISGKANQVLASLSDEVYVAISGLPLRLKYVCLWLKRKKEKGADFFQICFLYCAFSFFVLRHGSCGGIINITMVGKRNMSS